MVGALGYFEDVYDRILFSILRIPSLKSLGFSSDLLVSHGILLLNLQMLGMLAGDGITFVTEILPRELRAALRSHDE